MPLPQEVLDIIKVACAQSSDIAEQKAYAKAKVRELPDDRDHSLLWQCAEVGIERGVEQYRSGDNAAQKQQWQRQILPKELETQPVNGNGHAVESIANGQKVFRTRASKLSDLAARWGSLNFGGTRLGKHTKAKLRDEALENINGKLSGWQWNQRLVLRILQEMASAPDDALVDDVIPERRRAEILVEMDGGSLEADGKVAFAAQPSDN